MSEIKRGQNNISLSYYDNHYTIRDHHGANLTNIYWSRGRGNVSHGTMYLIHGYGGSPVEPCMKIPMEIARDNGFDVVAVEGVAISATSGDEKNINKMHLLRQKRAILEGLRFCKPISDISHQYNVVWAHSVSCRALSDLFVSNPMFNTMFNEAVLNNPYFVPPQRVQALYDRMMKDDPSGKKWKQLVNRIHFTTRQIDSVSYSIPTRLHNLLLPISAKLGGKDAPLAQVASRMSEFIGDLRVSFILGTADKEAEYAKNVEIFNNLKNSNKELISIDGADHAFENTLDAYRNSVEIIIDRIKSNIEHKK